MFTTEKIIYERKKKWKETHNIEQDRVFREATAKYIIEHEQLFENIQKNPEQLIEMLFIVVDKEQQTVPFFLNDVQKDFIKHVNKSIQEFKAGKRTSLQFLVLKGRQQGFTSVITAYQHACSITRKNFSGFTLADVNENTEAIFSDKAKFEHDMLPDIVKPTEKYNSRRELFFEKINSKWRVATAGNKNVGRSKTLNFFHGSECAFWEHLDTIMTALKPALTKDSIQILESTANGYNLFKDLWDDNNNWECLFFEWWRTKEYTLAFESTKAEKEFKENVLNSAGSDENAKLERWVYSRCKWLIEKIGLTWGQVYWYFNQWKDYKEKIKQEYPCSADEAFLASGDCVFPKEKIIRRIGYLKQEYKKKPYKIGRFDFDWNNAESKDKILDDSIRWVDDCDGCIKIYEQPQQGYPYVIGGDTKGEGKDYYAGTVKNNATGNRCAVLHGRWNNSKPYTLQMYCLGKYYNTALIGIEMNWNTAPIEELERLNYPTQYVREKKDTYTGQLEKRFGWRTDGITRPYIIDNEVSLVDSHVEVFNNIEKLQEMLTFVYDENNRPDAEEGKHDDLLFSDMICEAISTQQTHAVKEQPKEKFPINSLESKVQNNLEKLINKRRKKEGWFY